MKHDLDNVDFKSTSQFFWLIIKKFKVFLLLLTLAPILSAINNVCQPYLMKLIIETISNGVDLNHLKWLMIAYISIIALENIAYRLHEYVKMRFEPDLKIFIVNTLLTKMLKHSITLFHNQMSGNLANKISDVRSGIPALIQLISWLFDKILTFLISICVLYTVSYKFCLLLALVIICIMLMIWMCNAKSVQLVIASSRSKSLIVGRMVDIFVNIQNVLLFAATGHEIQDLKPIMLSFKIADQAMLKYVNKIFLLQGAIFIGYMCLVLQIIFKQVQIGQMSAGDFALVVNINRKLIGLMWDLSEDAYKLTTIIGDIHQGLEIALKPIDIKDTSTQNLDLQVNSQIEFREVCFKYTNKQSFIFENLSVKIAGRSKIGLVGSSGVGKSTFINLLLRFFESQAGQIYIGNQDIVDITLKSLRQNISVVPQDSSLFHRTIMDNIKYGKSDSTDAEVMEAAKKAQAHEFIMKLPNQYQTLVGERGVKLSGGQRHRISIARAILKDAPILILDEATSNLDSITEKFIQEELFEVMQDKTVIVIAHRLSTLLHLDRIIVLDQGKIVGDGTHDDLLKHNAVYQKLWQTQVNGFIVD